MKDRKAILETVMAAMLREPAGHLRSSEFHQQLGKKMAWMVQSSGMRFDTVMKKIPPGPVGDNWLWVADFAWKLLEEFRSQTTIPDAAVEEEEEA